MKGDKHAPGQTPAPGASGSGASLPNRILGSLRDALNAASREDRSGEISLGRRDAEASASARDSSKPTGGKAEDPGKPVPGDVGAVEAARAERHLEIGEPTKEVRRPAVRAPAKVEESALPVAAKTQALRGRAKVVRNAFHQDPVVGWLVVVGGAGLGAFRPIYEGNNGIGRAKSQRIPIDFGDDTISAEEQAYIRYDSMDRSFLFVPNLSKTNIVAVNDKKPTGAVKLEVMDVITMGRTQLAFVPFCGEDFDWSELSDLKE